MTDVLNGADDAIRSFEINPVVAIEVNGLKFDPSLDVVSEECDHSIGIDPPTQLSLRVVEQAFHRIVAADGFVGAPGAVEIGLHPFGGVGAFGVELDVAAVTSMEIPVIFDPALVTSRKDRAAGQFQQFTIAPVGFHARAAIWQDLRLDSLPGRVEIVGPERAPVQAVGQGSLPAGGIIRGRAEQQRRAVGPHADRTDAVAIRVEEIRDGQPVAGRGGDAVQIVVGVGGPSALPVGDGLQPATIVVARLGSAVEVNGANEAAIRVVGKKFAGQQQAGLDVGHRAFEWTVEGIQHRLLLGTLNHGLS